jgi:DNA-binding NarL/FixJ family response regulator
MRRQQPVEGRRGGCVSGTILIVDDSPIVRQALQAFIEGTKEWEVCGEAENGKAAVEKVKELHPDVVILDLQMPVMNGLEAAGQINQFAPNTTILMFTMHNSDQLLKFAPAVGIREVISKSDRLAEQLLVSLRRLQSERGDRRSMRTSR